MNDLATDMTFLKACQQGDIHTVEHLVGARDVFSNTLQQGLIVAALGGHNDVIDLLVSEDVCDNTGLALRYCVTQHNLSGVRLMTDAISKNSNDLHALMDVCFERNDIDMLQILLDKHNSLTVSNKRVLYCIKTLEKNNQDMFNALYQPQFLVGIDQMVRREEYIRNNVDSPNYRKNVSVDNFNIFLAEFEKHQINAALGEATQVSKARKM